MFGFFGKSKKNTEHKDTIILKKIINILFPPLEKRTAEDGMIYYVDHSVDMNLESVLSDLQSNMNDAVTRDSLNKSIKKLIEIRKLLSIQEEYKESPYKIVDMEREDDLENIEISSEIDA